MKFSVASGSISSRRPAFVSLTLLSKSRIHRYTEIRECIIFTFELRDMLSLQTGFSFVRAAVASLEKIPGFGPSSETTALRHLKLVTVPSFWLFTLISLWMPLALFVICLIFSALIFILYLAQVLLRFSTRASSSCSSSVGASTRDW